MITQEGRTSSQHDREAERQLEKRLQQFDAWAVSADRSDDGWEGYFPQWMEMMREAEQVMAGEHQGERILSLLGRCWALSEEDETCADWARDHLQDHRVQEMVRRLASDADPNTQWQAYDVLGSLPSLDDGMRAALEAGMANENSYVRRRAFLVLLRHPEIDARPYIVQMLADADVFNLSAARSVAHGNLKEAQATTNTKL